MRRNDPLEWQAAMHEALIAMNAAARAYQRLMSVVPVKGAEAGRPFAEINIHYRKEEDQ